jgi:hypothetical protein
MHSVNWLTDGKGHTYTFMGIEATAAGTGDEALRYLQAHRVDLVICDVRMPADTDGIQVYEWIQRNQPGLIRRFLFATGDLVGLNLDDWRGRFAYITRLDSGVALRIEQFLSYSRLKFSSGDNKWKDERQLVIQVSKHLLPRWQHKRQTLPASRQGCRTHRPRRRQFLHPSTRTSSGSADTPFPYDRILPALRRS